MKKQLSNVPQKGYSDWFAEDFAVQQYIFDTWRKVCKSFGYEEYLTPLMELADIYRAKSGEDIGGKELMTCVDRGGRELAIRPEMTPSVTRMVSRKYNELAKPIRYFSIANFVRNEKPQRGRTREFWQLNYDIFGSDSLLADIEVIQMGIEIMLAFNPPKNSFKLYLNNRKLIDDILNNKCGIENNNKTDVVRILDKWDKFDKQELTERLIELGLNSSQIKNLTLFAEGKSFDQLIKNFPDIDSNLGYKDIMESIDVLSSLGYKDYVVFNPSVIRGFDYYDGLVFEVFDMQPQNVRSIFGGGRYNGLASLFGKSSFPAVGCAPGNVTTSLFLQDWGILPEVSTVADYLVTVFSEELKNESVKIAKTLRDEGKNVELSFTVGNLSKQIAYARKRGIKYVVIIGDDEVKKGQYKIEKL
ncbi:MAG TPA: histidine--tRNA ligase [Candidatus Dojkabacteria bacterium]|nr:histidine--tRNA ligase [Candidatus Dojkabacteria bacterium]